MNLLTVMLCDTDAMIMLIDSTKTKDWPNGLAWKLNEKLCTKFKPGEADETHVEEESRSRVSRKQDCVS